MFSPTPILSRLKASSTPFSHSRKPNEEEKCLRLNKLLSAPFESVPVAELGSKNVLLTGSGDERTSSGEYSGFELLSALAHVQLTASGTYK